MKIAILKLDILSFLFGCLSKKLVFQFRIFLFIFLC